MIDGDEMNYNFVFVNEMKNDFDDFDYYYDDDG